MAEGEKIPRKNGPGLVQADILIINKIDLAPYVGASLDVMESDTKVVRGKHPEHFIHDPAGNLLDQSTEFQRHGSYANIKGNRLLMQGDSHFDYDAYGNLSKERRGAGQRLTRDYRYDSQHRLIGITLPDGSQVAYRYDAFGRRIAKEVDATTTQFIWQGERLIAEIGRAHV